MTRPLASTAWFFAVALTASSMSCASVSRAISDNTTIRFESVHAENPARRGLTVVKEFLGAAVGAPSSSRDDDLSLTLRLYLENNNRFTLSLTRITYTFLVDGAIVGTGSKEGKKGDLTFEPGHGRALELNVRVFTRELIGHVLEGVVKKGTKLTVNGRLTFDTAVGEATFSYSSEKTL